MSMFARSALRRAVPAARNTQVRKFSGHGTPEEMHGEVELWKKITGVGSIFVAGVFLNWLASEHHHMHKPPEYPYLKIRNKPLPWGDGSKDLLDVRHEYVEDDHH